MAVRLALDTNRYNDLCRGDASVVEAVELADDVWLPFIVMGELRAGFAVGTQGARNEAVLRRFLMKSGVGVLYADEQTTHHYAAVYRQLRKQGTPHPDQRYVDRSPSLATLACPMRPRRTLRRPSPTPARVGKSKDRTPNVRSSRTEPTLLGTGGSSWVSTVLGHPKIRIVHQCSNNTCSNSLDFNPPNQRSNPE